MTLLIDAAPLVAVGDLAEPQRDAILSTRIQTFDERHFRAVRPLHADAFTILPADA